MKSFLLKKEEVKRSFFIVDASNKVLGRLATQIAGVLSGKSKPNFTPHVDSGDIVIAINIEKIRITGNKKEQKTYRHYSGYPDGLRSEKLESLIVRKPQDVIKHAVKGMLPKNKFQKSMISRLKVYVGDKHPHQAQQPTVLK